ncbi:MAG: 50S ribosomal protein L10 [Patescibacteria group bacterium]
MAKTRQQKETTVKDLVSRLKSSKSIVFANFDKLKVKEIEKLRKNCHRENVDYVVAKKTLMKVAFKEAGITDVDPKTLDQGIALVLGINDEVAPARIIQDFAKDHEALKAIGGVLEGKFIPREKIIELAKLPSREVLLAKVLGSIKAPVSGFVNVLAGNLRNFVYVLNAIKETKN